MYDLWATERYAEAVAVQERIVRLFDVFVRPDGTRDPGYAIGSMKTACKLRGVIASNRMARPFDPVSSEQEERIRTIMTKTGSL